MTPPSRPAVSVDVSQAAHTALTRALEGDAELTRAALSRLAEHDLRAVSLAASLLLRAVES